ncbi:MAG: hypothetical protein IAI50_14860 [Candidatus Eremiobacteraeota bacterium]|nr:hypothetical protein [Candidatus Eremiobacteraeota bacterium]
MGLSINVLFTLLWCALGVFALRFVFSRFPGRLRAAAAAVAIVLAFGAGAYWPFSERIGQAAEVKLPVAAAPGQAAPSVGMRDLSAQCRGKQLQRSTGVGSLDVFRLRNGPGTPLTTGATLSTGDAVSVLGWSADRNSQSPAVGVCLIVDGRVDSAAHVRFGGPRPDVVAAYHRDTLLNSAFEIDLPARGLHAGNHTLRVAAISSDGQLGLVVGERAVTVR